LHLVCEPANATPSEVAALAKSAIEQRFERVGDVVRSKEGQLFAVDHPQADHPAARFVQADAKVAQLTTEAAWHRVAEAQAQAVAPAPAATADAEERQRGFRIA
jgi:hypothetical protein